MDVRFKRKLKRFLYVFSLIILGLWLFTTQFLMQDRVSDKYAGNYYQTLGIELKTHFVKINDRTIHYAQTGNDTMPTLFFIHGSPGSWYNYRGYLSDSALIKKYRLISVDRPGFGFSGFGNTINLEKQSAYLSSLISTVNNGKAVYLVGHSLGGPLAIKMAANPANNISGVVVIAGSVSPELEQKEYWRPIITYSPIRWFAPSAFRYSNEEIWYLKKDLLKLKEDFQKVYCPVIIFHGDKDEHVPAGNVEYAKKNLINSAGAEAIIFPGKNHFIVWTDFKCIRDKLLLLK